MKTLLSTTGWTSLVAFALSTAAVAADQDFSLLASASWESFVTDVQPASLAWSGEDETLVEVENMLTSVWQVAQPEEDVNIEIVTALPAPEPPALVLAGMAFGGMVCSRSFLLQRRKQA